MDNKDSPNIDEIYKAIAHSFRREMLGWMNHSKNTLANQEYSSKLGICAGNFFKNTSLSKSTISSHLTVLQKAGLIVSRKEGQWILYFRNESLIKSFLKRIESEL